MKSIESGKENEQHDLPPITLLVRDKSDKDKENYSRLIEGIQESKQGKIIGGFLKDSFPNDFITEFKKLYAEKLKVDSVDVSSAFAYIMSSKEETELDIIKKACNVTVDVFNKYVKEQLMEIIDADKKVRHIKLSEGVDKAITDKKYVKNIDIQQLDMCYPAIIQSGGNYNLKFSVSR